MTRRHSRRGGGPAAGWLLGHAIAHGQCGVSGDPLANGRLGNPANRAYWGGLLSVEVSEEADDCDDELDADRADDAGGLR